MTGIEALKQLLDGNAIRAESWNDDIFWIIWDDYVYGISTKANYVFKEDIHRWTIKDIIEDEWIVCNGNEILELVQRFV